jgi:hypothetical protein
MSYFEFVCSRITKLWRYEAAELGCMLVLALMILLRIHWLMSQVPS